MKRLLVVVLTIVLALGIIGPAWWAASSAGLPPLSSEFDLQRYFGGRIEGERMAMFPAATLPNKSELAFKPPELSNYPQDAVGLFISGLECPTYFQSPRESDGAWMWRLFKFQLTGSVGGPGDATCEFQLAQLLAWNLRIRGGLAETVAINRIRTALPKGKLVAYALATQEYAPGVIGLEWASQVLYHRPLASLKLDELAELSLALPPQNAYPVLLVCSNISAIRQARDAALVQVANESLVAMDKAKVAKTQPVLCSK